MNAFKYFKYTELEKLNIEKIINRFGDDYRITSKGNLDYCCPFCMEKRGKLDNDYKFGVDVKTTMYHCFKCHSSGIVVKNKASHNEKIIPFISNYFIDTFDNSSSIDSVDNKLLALKNVSALTKDSVAYDYLQKRQITDEQIMYYNIMTGINDNFGRIIIPNMIIANWTDFYQGRSYLGHEPKYLNPESIDKSNIVFNLHNQVKKQKRVYIVEGVFSAIRGGKDVISIYGSSVSENQINLIKKYKFEEIYCCLDGDEAGTLGNSKLGNALFEQTDSKIYMIKLPVNKDPADLGELKFKEYCEKYKKPYISEKINSILSYFDY